MDTLKELENRITLAIDRISQKIEQKADKMASDEKLIDQIASLNDQNQSLSKALADLEAKRSEDSAEIRQLYEKLAAALNDLEQPQTSEKGMD